MPSGGLSFAPPVSRRTDRLFPISSAFPVKGFQPVTWAIIGLCALVAFLQLMLPPDPPVETIYLRYGAHPALVMFDFLPWNADSPSIAWTAFTSLFVHAGIMHVLMNMLFFHCFSLPVESLMGSVRYALFYILCGIAGVVVHSAVNPDSFTPLVGASGAVTGVLAAHTLLLPWTKIRIGGSAENPKTAPAWGFTAFWIFLQLLEALDSNSTTAFGAHAGGGIAGLMLAPLFVKRGVRVLARPDEDTEHALEYDDGFAVSWPFAVAIAAVLFAGLGTALVNTQGAVDPLAATNAREWVALARLEGGGVPLDTARGLSAYRAAAAEDPKIATRLAAILHAGKIVPKNDGEAAQWYERGAMMKDPDAVSAYALMLIDGNVIDRHRDRGLAMLRDLANDGFASADLQLGQVLESGRGEAEPDIAGAAHSYKHGCDGTASERVKSAGRYDACRRYAQMLKEGRGVPRDLDEAAKVLNRIEAQKLLDAGFEAFQQRR